MDAEALESSVQEFERQTGSVYKNLNKVFKSISLNPSFPPNKPAKKLEVEKMKTKNLIILCLWSALSVVFALLMWFGVATAVNPTQWLIWMENDFFIFFIIALIFTGAVAFLLPEKKETETELIDELQEIRSKLHELTKEVDRSVNLDVR